MCFLEPQQKFVGCSYPRMIPDICLLANTENTEENVAACRDFFAEFGAGKLEFGARLL